MQKNFKLILFIVVAFVFKTTDAQQKSSFKDVLLNGKPARLNLATGEFIFQGSDGKDSIVNVKKNNIKEDLSIDRLNYHVVQEGESLEIIAKQYGLTIRKIKTANNLKTSLVNIGQKLRVRNFYAVEEAKPDAIWIVSKGHSLYHISRKTGVSVKTLKRLNGLKNNNLSIGQKLYLK